jgi:ABC-type nitrate/sulfonate/bicarbonate transport system permease component
MEQAVPAQPPAVVLRSRYKLVRALLGIAIAAIVALGVAVVVLASDRSDASGTSAVSPTQPIEYGGFSPNAGRPESAPWPEH